MACALLPQLAMRTLLLRVLPLLVLLGAVPSSPAHAASPLWALFKGALQGQININTATAEQLELLPGVGPATAQKIIAYRERRPFTKPSHLLRIDGIGPKTYAAMQPHVIVEGETTLREVSAPP